MVRSIADDLAMLMRQVPRINTDIKMSNTKKMPAEVVAQYAGKVMQVLHAREMTSGETTAIHRAFYQKGKSAGVHLKRKAPSPSSDPWAYAAWAGIQPNSHKAMACAGGVLMYLDDEQQAFCKMLMKVKWPSSLDIDMQNLMSVGAW